MSISERDLASLERTADDRFHVGADGVRAITATGDRRVEWVTFAGHTLACVRSSMGYPAYYPVHPVRVERPVEAVLMDLDGTTVHSESFWMSMIEQTTATVLGQPSFTVDGDDLPHVSGHSVSEHLQYCLAKYAPQATLEEARAHYFSIVRREMREILEGRGRADAFLPAEGLKEFLLALKEMNVRIALVTSGLYEKAYPAIVAAFRAMEMGRPEDFYDVIITAGFPLGEGAAGTMGELSLKPHPWLYAEAARVGLGIPFERRHQVVGIEDSSAGICALRLAGFAPIGIAGGNIEQSGARELCHVYCQDFTEVLDLIQRGPLS